MRLSLIAIALTVCSSAAPAASFPCSAASTPVEQQVCSDPSLSQLDDTLALRFKSRLASASDAAGVRAEQRAWLVDERNRCSDASCLHAAYEKRIAALSPQTPAVAQTRASGNSGCATLDRVVKTTLDAKVPAISVTRFGGRFVSAWHPADFDAFQVVFDRCKTNAAEAPTLYAFSEESKVLLYTLRHRATLVDRSTTVESFTRRFVGDRPLWREHGILDRATGPGARLSAA